MMVDGWLMMSSGSQFLLGIILIIPERGIPKKPNQTNKWIQWNDRGIYFTLLSSCLLMRVLITLW